MSCPGCEGVHFLSRTKEAGSCCRVIQMLLQKKQLGIESSFGSLSRIKTLIKETDKLGHTLVGGFKYFVFSSLFGEMIQSD